MLAAHWDHHSYAAFRERDGDYQSKIVAAFRVDQTARAVAEHEAQREARQRHPAPPRRAHR